MNSFCLYHQLTNEKSKQKNGLNTSSGSANKSRHKFTEAPKEKNFINSSNIPQKEFNDYTIYAEKDQTKNRKIKLEINKTSQKDQFSGQIKKSDFKTVRFQQTFDQQYFANEQKSFKSSKSAKNSKERFCFAKEQPIRSNSKRQQYKNQKIDWLESQISALNKKIQVCESQTRKNHFEFVLLRDIVQKIKIQNLELLSKMNFYDDYIKTLKNKQIDFQNYMNDNIKFTAQSSNQNTMQNRKNIFSRVSCNYTDEYLQIHNATERDSSSNNSVHLQNSEISKMPNDFTSKNNDNHQKAEQFQKSSKSDQKTKQQSKHQNSMEAKLKNQMDSTRKSTIKRSKPKKILHFQNVLKQNKNSKECPEKNQKIQQLFSIHQFDQIQKESSMSISEENLLESVQIIRKKSQCRPLIQNQIYSNQTKKVNYENDDTSIDCGPIKKQTDKCFKINLFKTEQSGSSIQVQSQYKQLIGVLDSIKSKQILYKQQPDKLLEVKIQKQRVKKIILALQHNYHLSSNK